ncbi:ENTH-domain-containing protein [Laetiporus sulphureus 93-53]|uniref:ENTH-domain-containing protein n=1 Tax=Laetiporus sulphureus 93-53 TaxID=1314785 RepID=A0A165CLP7_9APHY|nr:ENTH-domain-containing protein [Laetiporus sulphureus 93-53]KZT03033.1 ENTH-domain-containing protein [Laetiporus sulphureus 93-53]
MQHFGKGMMRVAKNYTKGYSEVQAKVRDATSNDPWGPSGTQMNEIAQMTFNQNDFIEVMEMLDKRLNDKGKNWRHVFKSLTVLDYLLHAGSENVVIYFKDNIYIVKTLKEFQYIDEDGKDQGANVRQKAKDITNLLQDDERLRKERRSRANMRDRMVRGRGGTMDGADEFGDENAQRRSRSLPPRRQGTETDAELQRAIEESKRSLAEEQAQQGWMTAEERDLQQAIKLSEEEEARRAKAIADSNNSSLFDDPNQSTNPFPLVDMSATGLQPQFTSMQPQFTSFNPYQQQAQQEAMQAEYMRQQQEWMQQQQQLQAQQQAQLMAAQQEEMMRQQMLAMQQQQQQQMLMAQPTGFGSNNPFAPSTSPAVSVTTSSLGQYSHSMSASPAPQSSSPVFNLQGTYANTPSSASPPPPSHSAPPRSQTAQGKTRADEQHAHLADLFANREDGIDTFGNFGQLRYGQQAGRLIGQSTGQPQSSYNPFSQQQQSQQSSEQPFFSI